MEFSWQLLHQQYWLFMLILNIQKKKKKINLLLVIQNQKSEKICLVFEKKEKHPKKASDLIENAFISCIISENPTVEVLSFNIQNVEFYIFSQETSSIHVYSFYFFPWGDCIKPKIQDNWERPHSNVNLKLFFKWSYRLGQEKVLFSAISARTPNYDFTLKRLKFAINLKLWEIKGFKSINNYI